MTELDKDWQELTGKVFGTAATSASNHDVGGPGPEEPPARPPNSAPREGNNPRPPVDDNLQFVRGLFGSGAFS